MTPAVARNRFVMLTALTWLPTALQIPVLVLLGQVRGLNLAEVGLAFAVYSVSVAVLELPTGGLADVVGRRTVLVVSAATTLGGTLGLAVATTLPEFLVLAVLSGAARALSSGPAEAWYVDTLQQAVTRDSEELRHGLAAGNVAAGATLAVGTLIGGGLPLVTSSLTEAGPLVPLSAPRLLAAVAAAGLLVASVVGMPEPPRDNRAGLATVFRGVPETILSGLRLGVRDRLLSRVLVISAIFGVALNSIELLTPGRLADLTGSAGTGSTAYALVTAVGFGAVSLGSAISPRLARRLGGRSDVAAAARTAILGTVLAAGSLAGLTASTALDGPAGIVAAGAAYTGMFTGVGIGGPVYSELLHRGVTAQERATLVSVDSLMLQLGGTAAAIGAGALAARWSVAPAWWLAATALLGGAALLFPATRSDRPSEDPTPGEPAPTTTDEAAA